MQIFTRKIQASNSGSVDIDYPTVCVLLQREDAGQNPGPGVALRDDVPELAGTKAFLHGAGPIMTLVDRIARDI